MSSNAGCGNVFSQPVAAMEYRDIGSKQFAESRLRPLVLVQPVDPAGKRHVEVELSNEELAERIRQERAEASTETEKKLRQEYEAKMQETRAELAKALVEFQAQRSDYFSRVEAEVIQMSLAIAAKILRREAQVDPMLVAVLVRMTIEKMREGSTVTVRVGAGLAAAWKAYFAGQPMIVGLEVVEDLSLSQTDCIVETELGTTNFGLDQQLKELERGFFDLLALRPEGR
jgi:flagellar assembly protein FliH